MSSSAGTPSAPSLKVAGSGRASSLEPSPASTYGSSASSDTGDDVPQTPNDGVFLTKLAKLSLKDVKDVKDESKADVARYSPPFVRNGSQGRADDPFTSPVTQRHGSAQRTPTGPKFMNRAAKSDNWRSGSSSGSDSGPSSPTADKALRSAQGGRGVFVCEYASENAGLRTFESVSIKAEDAQAYYPPSSCVFVANLLQSESDEALEVAVTQVFREYGVVFVKIRRDAKHMPFAFCQYTNDHDATRAIKEGRGRTIKGRPCRCEKAKAHRLFFFERKYGAAITPQEVEDLLRGFGRINYCRPVSLIERATHNLDEGVIVQFELYDEGQAALQAYRNHEEYKMQSLANMDMSSPSRDRVHEDPVGRHYLDEYDIERRSIYVGNLPTDAVNDDLRDVFVKFGTIIKVTLHKNESIIDANQQRCFGFVEFETQPSITLVLTENQANGFTLRGMLLRVAQKDTNAATARSHRRRPGTGVQPSATAYQSPAPQPMAQQQVSPMAHLSPQAYASQYSSPAYASPFAYYNAYGTAMYAGNQAAYYGSPYAPLYYPSSPTYHAGGSTTSTPLAQQYIYQGYQTTPTYGYSPPAHQAAFPPAAYSQPVINTTGLGHDERSGTPTPAGHVPGFESLDSYLSDPKTRSLHYVYVAFASQSLCSS
ncbi:hypothetical protein EG329_006592 [Mollisiaceae sp. DMI_Dod_QoI]|nr:hypothetical protein EG329_006592 [Helotiales sp. DMI_Dod_QoI]